MSYPRSFVVLLLNEFAFVALSGNQLDAVQLGGHFIKFELHPATVRNEKFM